MPVLGGARRVSVAAATSLFALAGLAITAGVPSAHADATAGPAEDCTPAYTGALTDGQTVHGLTVSSGTTPEEFTGTVLGVVNQGVDADTDMIVMRLTSDAITAAGGIWEGMSGSPVYDDVTGELIGAVAFGLATGSSPVAGITPYSAMADALPKTQVTVGNARLAARIASAADVPTSKVGFEPLAIPVSVTGVTAGRLQRTAAKGGPVHTGLATGRIGNAAATAGDDLAPVSTVTAGGNMAAMMVYGDVAEGGIGTVTSVCDGRVMGFGHPMNGTGDSALTLMSADAVFVQEDPLGVPFKVANLGQVAGTIDEDRAVGIAGPLGTGPAAAEVTSTASYRGRTLTGTSYVAQPDYYADAAFYQPTAIADAAIKARVAGSALTTYRIEGTDPQGRPFTLEHTDRYLSSSDISGDSAWDLGYLVSALGSMSGVHLTSVTTTATIEDQRRVLRLAGLQQRVRGQWRYVSALTPVHVAPGRTARLRVALAAADGTISYARTTLTAPHAHTTGSIELVGGRNIGGRLALPSSVPGAQAYVAGLVRHDQVRMTTRLRGSHTAVLAPMSQVVSGRLSVPVTVG